MPYAPDMLPTNFIDNNLDLKKANADKQKHLNSGNCTGIGCTECKRLDDIIKNLSPMP